MVLRRSTSGVGETEGDDIPLVDPRLRNLSSVGKAYARGRDVVRKLPDSNVDIAISLVEDHVRALLRKVGGIKVTTNLEGNVPILRIEADDATDKGINFNVSEVIAGIKQTIVTVFGSTNLVVQQKGNSLTVARSMDDIVESEQLHAVPKTPKARDLKTGERFIYAGKTPKTVDYQGRMDITGIGCFELVYPAQKTIYASLQKNPEGQIMAIFSRYPVSVDGWERPKQNLGVHALPRINLCEVFGIPHKQEDFIHAREKGRPHHDVFVQGLGHFAVILQGGRENSLNLAPLSSYPKGVFSVLNQRINAFLKEHPEYAKIANGTNNGIPQFVEDDLAALMG